MLSFLPPLSKSFLIVSFIFSLKACAIAAEGNKTDLCQCYAEYDYCFYQCDDFWFQFLFLVLILFFPHHSPNSEYKVPGTGKTTIDYLYWRMDVKSYRLWNSNSLHTFLFYSLLSDSLPSGICDRRIDEIGLPGDNFYEIGS